MASAWSLLQVRSGSWASLRFAQGAALVDSKVKFSAEAFSAIFLIEDDAIPRKQMFFWPIAFVIRHPIT